MYEPLPFSHSSVRLLPLVTAGLVATGCNERPGPTELESPAEPYFLTTSTEIAPGSSSGIFNESTEVGSVFAIEFSDGESELGPAAVSIPQLVLLHPAFNPALQPILTQPPSLPELANDCEALANVEVVKGFLADADQFAEGIASNVEACAAEVSALAEEILSLIESAEEVEFEIIPPPGCPVYGPVDLFRGVLGPFGSLCQECTTALTNVTLRLEALSRYAAECNQIREDLEMLRERVLRELDGGELSGEVACLADPGELEEFARIAEILEESARLAAAAVASTIESGVCCDESLGKSCEECPSSDEEETLTEYVFEVPAGPAIDHIVGALNTAASLTDDDDEAEALKELAFRLETTPRDLARRVVFPAEVPATVDLLAVRPSFAVDGRPPVFILSAVPEEILPEATLLDEARWFQETDAWRGMFTKGPIEF